MNPHQARQLEAALGKLPKKGDTKWKFKGWDVAENLHEWALAHGFLTGCVFLKATKSGPGGKATKLKARLLLVGNCPWGSENLRFYAASLDPADWEGGSEPSSGP